MTSSNNLTCVKTAVFGISFIITGIWWQPLANFENIFLFLSYKDIFDMMNCVSEFNNLII